MIDPMCTEYDYIRLYYSRTLFAKIRYRSRPNMYREVLPQPPMGEGVTPWYS